MPLLDKLLTERGKRMTTKKKSQDKLSLYQPLHKGINLTEEQLCYSDNTNRPKQIPIAKILKYTNKGLSNSEIAGIIGCSRENITYRLKPYNQAIKALPDYQARELDLIDLAKAGILDELIKRVYDPEEGLKRMAIPQLAMTFGILTDKGQAIKGKAPAAASNLSVNIVFDPGMLPKSDGAKHLDKDNGVIMVDVQAPEGQNI
jgi:hypothetical protein